MTAAASAEYLVLEAELPGRGAQPVGVLLHDPESGRVGMRLRRDWDRVAGPDEIEFFEGLASTLEDRARELPAEEFLGWLEDTLSNVLRISERRPVIMGRFESTLRVLYERSVPAEVRPFRTHLPVYTCRAAAGKWGDGGEVSEEGWIEAPEGLRMTEDMFVARVEGQSMEPKIPDGSLCVFRAKPVGSRLGKLVLVENLDETQSGGDRYTVKRWKSRPNRDGQGEWHPGQSSHSRILLEPLNPAYQAWEINEDSRTQVIAEFVRVLE